MTEQGPVVQVVTEQGMGVQAAVTSIFENELDLLRRMATSVRASVRSRMISCKTSVIQFCGALFVG